MQRYFILFFPFLSLLAGAQDTVVVRDLSRAWISMDKDGNPDPYLPGDRSRVIFFELPEDLQEGSALRLKATKPVDVWINDRLVLHHFDSIRHFDDISSGDQFKVYGQKGISGIFTSNIVRLEEKAKEIELNPISEKRSRGETEHYLVLMTIILLLAGVYRQFFPITFNQSIRNPLSSKVRSISVDQTYVNFGSIDNLFSIFYFGGLITFLFNFLGYNLTVIKDEIFINALLNWLLASLGISVLILIKFLWIRLIAALYQLRELPNIQIQDFVHFFTLIATGGILITFIDFTLFDSTASFLKSGVKYLTISSLLFFQFWLFLKVDKFSSFRKLMIILYLCTTEFLPGFLAIYWLTEM